MPNHCAANKISQSLQLIWQFWKLLPEQVTSPLLVTGCELHAKLARGTSLSSAMVMSASLMCNHWTPSGDPWPKTGWQLENQHASVNNIHLRSLHTWQSLWPSEILKSGVDNLRRLECCINWRPSWKRVKHNSEEIDKRSCTIGNHYHLISNILLP
jgi:hypothetical protein